MWAWGIPELGRNNLARKGAFLMQKFKRNRAAAQQISNATRIVRPVNHCFSALRASFPLSDFTGRAVSAGPPNPNGV